MRSGGILNATRHATSLLGQRITNQYTATMRLQRIAYLLAAALVLGLAVGCNKKEKKEDEQVQRGDLLIQVIVPNPDGMSGSCFIQMVDSKFGAQVTEQKAYFANMIGKIQIVDLEKFEPIGEIDVSSYAAQGTGLSYPQTGFPLATEGKVYFPLWRGRWATPPQGRSWGRHPSARCQR